MLNTALQVQYTIVKTRGGSERLTPIIYPTLGDIECLW